jgi:hypothetical protein
MGLEEGIPKFDEDFNGIIGENGYYGFEHQGGWRENGPMPSYNPKSRMKEICSSLNKREIASSKDDKIPPETLNRLKDLGYA